MNKAAIKIRASICSRCQTPCEHKDSTDFHSSPSSECPIKKWSRVVEPAVTHVDPVSSPMRGLGDLVAKIADPIAKAINLDKSKCGCSKRQEALNRMVPFDKITTPIITDETNSSI